MKSSYDRKIDLSCPACGGKYFEQSASTVTCSNCKKVFSDDQLQEANKRKINATIESQKKEVFADIQKDFQKMLKKSFGSGFKIK